MGATPSPTAAPTKRVPLSLDELLKHKQEVQEAAQKVRTASREVIDISATAY